MLFSLEALDAKKGDALILHFGESSARPQFIVIDGGPATVLATTGSSMSTC
jgi:hypothetical protein